MRINLVPALDELTVRMGSQGYRMADPGPPSGAVGRLGRRAGTLYGATWCGGSMADAPRASFWRAVVPMSLA